MPRTENTVVENNFKGGFITEATGLNFPPDACVAAENVVFTENGEVKRRLGFGYEANYSLATLTTPGLHINGYNWNNVGNDGQTSFRVQQIGSNLHFWNTTITPAISQSKNATVIDLTTYETDSNNGAENNICQFAATNKYLVVTHPYLEPIYITYDPAADSFSATQITLEIRDFMGLDDSLDIDERPTATVGTMTTAHKYNLFNQGWYYNSNAALTAWDTARSDLPSSADVWWYYKDTSDAFDASTVANYDPGFTPAPKGHYILNVHNEDRDAASGLSGITDVTTGARRVSTCAFFAGRVFYAGLNASGYSSKIYFTQVIENFTQIGRCYQKNDPTSEIASALGPADGGVIHIYECENIIKMIPLQGALLVFATNGVWSITGSDAVGFTASDYTVSKITSIPALAPSSFVVVENQPMWWNEEGIYVLATNDQGNLDARSLTDKSIRTFFLNIPTRNKLFTKAAYDASRKEVKWVYRVATSDEQTEDYKFDSVLTLNLLTGAFSNWVINVDDVFIHDVYTVNTQGGPQTFNNLIEADGDNIQDSSGNDVVISSLSSTVVRPVFKYLVGNGTQSTFAETNNNNYIDWFEHDSTGVDYTSTFTTGYRLDGESMKFFQSNYVMVFLKEEANASATMRAVWDWTTSSAEGKYSSSQQVYTTRHGNRSLRFRRLKVRGKGRALQLMFTSETGKPFTIVGWSIWETANQGV